MLAGVRRGVHAVQNREESTENQSDAGTAAQAVAMSPQDRAAAAAIARSHTQPATLPPAAPPGAQAQVQKPTGAPLQDGAGSSTPTAAAATARMQENAQRQSMGT